MTTIKIPKKEFEKQIKITKEIEEKIPMMGVSLESINDSEIELEIFPNRPDLLSLQGFLRAFKAFLGKEKGLKKYKLNKPEKNFEVIIDKSVENIRPFTACAIVKGLKFDNEKIKEVIDIQEKIHATLGRNRKKIAIGIYPLEKINLPIKFEARDPKEIKFVPLEMSHELNGLQILQQHPTGREYASLLEGFNKFPVFVDAKGKILSMPPIINSQETGKITEQTKDIFIECSGFNFNILKKTLNILSTMFADMGGKIYQMRLKYNKQKLIELTPDFKPEKMKLEIENVNKLLGLQLKEKEIKALLERMGYDYKNKTVFIPAWRTDIMHEVDLIEDIAIAYGYENFEPEIPKISTIGEEDKIETIKKKVAEILVGLNMLEISSYHLVTKDDLKKINEKPRIEIENSKTDYSVLRPNLLCNIMKILSENIDKEYPQKIFEIGTVFSPDEKSETGIKESTNLCIALAPGNFTETKQILDYLTRTLEIKLEIETSEHSALISGRTGKIIFNNKEIGFIGEIHPGVLKKTHLKLPISIIEICLDDIINEIIKEKI
ncbi:MAG: phenylalanine--tRNA ligase subunit beta [Candidatus Pacearchaeota archaeon]